MKKYVFPILVLVVLFAASWPLQSLALGQMTEPIVIENALRASEYQELMIAVNTEDAAGSVSLSAEGDITGWVKFYLPDDLKNAVETVDIGPRQNKNIAVVFTVPSDAPNGKYAGLISVIKKPTAASVKEGSSSSVSQKIDREVTIIVGGEEKIGLQVSVIPKSYDLQKNAPLDIRFIFDNLGNVSLRPQIDLKIKTLDGQVVYNAIYPYPENEQSVRPGAQYEIPAISVPTTGLKNGKYLVETKFLHSGQTIFEKSFKFSIGSTGLVAGLKTVNPIIFWPVTVIALMVLGGALMTLKRIKNLKNSGEKMP